VFGHNVASIKQADEGDEEAESEVQPVGMSLLKHSFLTALIVPSGYIIAYFVDDLRVGECFSSCLGGGGVILLVYSPRFRWGDWIDYYLIHPSWLALLAPLP
jgi:hypothetical protein